MEMRVEQYHKLGRKGSQEQAKVPLLSQQSSEDAGRV